MTRVSCGLLAFGSLTLVAAPVSAQTVSEYDAVRAARPAGRTIPVNGLTLVRDAYRIDLRSGVLHLLAPIDGETFGAVFLGEGEYRLEPATARSTTSSSNGSAALTSRRSVRPSR